MLEEIIGSKSKIKILRFLVKNPANLYSIRSISLSSDVPYSVTHRDINEFFKLGIILTENNKIRLNINSQWHQKLKEIFTEKQVAQKQLNTAKLERMLAKNKEALFILHHNADPDTVGSSIAFCRGLAQLGIKTRIMAPQGISKQSKSVLDRYPYPIEESIEKFPKLVFILDTSSPEQINTEIPESSKLVIIDHHIEGELAKGASAAIIDSDAHSTAFIAYRALQKLGVEITKEIAFFLLVGIIADTNYLRLVNKNELQIVVELLDFFELEEVYVALSTPEDISKRIAKLKASQRMEFHIVKDLIVAFSRSGSFESSAALGLIKSGADIAIVENIQKNEIRISARERQYLKSKINLVKILKKIEPLIDGHAGGHVTAASANGKNVSADIRKVLLDEVKKC